MLFVSMESISLSVAVVLIIINALFVVALEDLAPKQFSVLTDFSAENCIADNRARSGAGHDDEILYFKTDEYGFSTCDTYKGSESEKDCVVDNDCEPAYICDKSLKKCKINEISCFKYYAYVDENKAKLNDPSLGSILLEPTCLDDGSWAPKQCKGGGGGRCFCYDDRGNRIFGSSFADDADDMTCGCSRRKADLLAEKDPKKKRFYVSFHCDKKGNYEPLQCDSGFCWCVHPTTGSLKSPVVPQSAIKLLSCFATSSNYGSQYLRKCESKAYAQTLIAQKMLKHGVTKPNINPILCEGDGSYGPYTIESGQTYCVTKYNEHTLYHAPIGTTEDVNCFCSQDQIWYKEMGKDFTSVCADNGNYKIVQGVTSSKPYCVDQDGYKLINVPSDPEYTNMEQQCKIFYPYAAEK